MTQRRRMERSRIQIEQLSEADQQEYAEWLEWKRKERIKARERKKKREEAKKQHRLLLNIARYHQAHIDAYSSRLEECKNKRSSDEKGDNYFTDYFWSDEDPDYDLAQVEHLTKELERHESALDKIQSQLTQMDHERMSYYQDNAEDDYCAEIYDSEDTAYDSAEDETPLMMLINGFNFLQSFIKPAQPRESRASPGSSPPARYASTDDENDDAKDQITPDNSVSSDETDMEEVDPDLASLSLMDRSPRSRSSSSSSISSSTFSEIASKPFTFPFAGTLDRLRKKQRARERRQRLSELCPLDGLPQALPLMTCGHWIKVINLQQDTPFRHHTSLQHLYPQQHLEPRWRASRMTEHLQGPAANGLQLGNNTGNNNNNGQEPQRRSYLSFLFGHRPISDFDEEEAILSDNEDHPDQQAAQQQQHHQAQSHRQRLLPDVDFDLESTEGYPLTRHDFVSDHTLQIILDHCPNLARLTLSECTRITDRGLEMIRNSECVAREQLVSLHMAGCWRITDHGLASLVEAFPVDDIGAAEQTSRMVQLKLESLDIAGCWQVTDKGLTAVLRACGSRLTQLRVSNCELITGESVLELAKHCPKMRWLDLARTGEIQDTALRAVATHCDQLEWLNLARVHPEETNTDSGSQSPSHSHLPSLPDQHSQTEASASQPSSADVTDTDGGDDGSESNEISDETIGLLGENCPQLQLLDLSYIRTVTNESMELLSQHATSLVCLTIIGCPGITAQALYALAQLRNSSGKLSCITMGDALGISESDIEKIMQGTLSGWQKSSVEETSMSDILGGLSWEDD
ncbi:hypothetical protein BGW41_001456 [Actinomortierella wolfii]|nr:hypothetical protein BGW41_001456 [Actinomortierella wolfii]